MNDVEQRQFDHLMNGIKTNLKLWEDTPPHARFGFPAFQIEAVSALVNQLDAKNKEIDDLKSNSMTLGNEIARQSERAMNAEHHFDLLKMKFDKVSIALDLAKQIIKECVVESESAYVDHRLLRISDIEKELTLPNWSPISQSNV